jgi:transcriptional regulator with XRE-family HTH domain
VILIEHLEHLCHAAFGSTTDVKERTLDGFGARLTALRQAQGLTQDELGTAVGISNRMIAYYERDGAQPPGAILVELAKALRVSTDELLGVRPVRETLPPKTARLLKRLRRVEELPPADQRAVLKLVDAMLETRRRATPPTRKRKAS